LPPYLAALSSWFNNSSGRWPQATLDDIRRGIRSNAEPTKPNSKGWVNIARIENTSRSGSIFETAGRKNKDGRAAFQLTIGANMALTAQRAGIGAGYAKALKAMAQTTLLQVITLSTQLRMFRQ
jgi:hypothetical protein